MDRAQLTPATSGFALAAAITVLFNTALACAKDAYFPLKAGMKWLAGHDWTAQSLMDLALFVGLGLVLTNLRIAEKIDSARLIGGLIGSVAVAGVALALWYAFT
jgi:hypothetical protein